MSEHVIGRVVGNMGGPLKISHSRTMWGHGESGTTITLSFPDSAFIGGDAHNDLRPDVAQAIDAGEIMAVLVLVQKK